jgi:hypothetical protein
MRFTTAVMCLEVPDTKIAAACVARVAILMPVLQQTINTSRLALR